MSFHRAPKKQILAPSKYKTVGFYKKDFYKSFLVVLLRKLCKMLKLGGATAGRADLGADWRVVLGSGKGWNADHA